MMRNRLLPLKLIISLGLLLFTVYKASAQELNPLTIAKLRVEYHSNPIGLDVKKPRFSWELQGEDRNRAQSAYQIIVASSKANLDKAIGDIWDSGKTASNATNQIEYAGEELRSQSDYFWRVKVWDEQDLASDWSEDAFWSTGVFKYAEWKGLFLGYYVGHRTGDKYKELYLPPARYLRKSFQISKPIKKAMAYTTAKGIYELRLNGAKVSDKYLLPGWTDYDKRLYYQTFDITSQLQQGENVIGSIIADGWYAGYVGYGLTNKRDEVRSFYGENPAFLGQLRIEYEDGSVEVLATDYTWKANTGPILEADLLMGETYDARLEHEGWDRPGFNDDSWKQPKAYPYSEGRLQAYPSNFIKVRERIRPIAVTEPEPGIFVYNFGKNFAGIITMAVNGTRGTELEFKYGEILNSDGTVMTVNLRSARATDTYILKGGGTETWEPKFTFHGFQYVQITGLENKTDLESIEALVLSSIDAKASTFESSSPMNNKLYENILTTQKANFFEIPTDCPQRDERLGWLGDAQVFCRSATYNADVAAFLSKYLVDVDDAQRWYGAYTNFAPFPYSFSREHEYSPAWMDAGVIIPYNLLKVYGDKRIVEYMYPGIERFMEFQADASTDFIRPPGGNNWGDHLAVGEETSKGFVAASHYGYDAKLMIELAKALGKEEDVVKYKELFQNIKEAFAKKYILNNGYTTEDTQTTYALALYFDLYPQELAAKGAARLAQKIEENGDKFTTGFHGTKYVMLVLAQYGYHDLSYRLFKQTEYPSWGFSVVNGSTSIWERWNSYTDDEEQNDLFNRQMNSFSHYAFGSVAEWMFLYALGIDTKTTGYQDIIIKPSFSKEMQYISGSYHSIKGLIASHWEWKGNKLIFKVTIPVNTKAEVYLPVQSTSSIKEGNRAIEKVDDIKIVRTGADGTVLEVGSGDYEFSLRMK